MNWHVIIPLIASAISAVLVYLYSNFRNRKINSDNSSKTDLFNAQLSSYRARISQLESELENEKYNTADVSSIESQLTASISRISELEAELENTKEIPEGNKEKTLEDIELYKQEILELEKDIKGSTLKMLRLEGQIECRKNELENDENVVLRTQKEKLELEITAKSSEIHHLESELDLYIANYTELNIEFENKNEEIKSFILRYNQLEESLKVANEKVLIQEKELQDIEGTTHQLSEKNEKISELETKLKSQIEEYSTLSDIAKENDEQLELYTIENNKLQDNLKVTEEKISSLENELKEKEEINATLSKNSSKIPELEAELESFMVEYDKLSDLSKADNDQLKQYKTDLIQLENDLKLTQENTANLENQLKEKEDITAKLAESNSKANQLEAELKSFKIEYDSLSTIAKTNDEQLEQLDQNFNTALENITTLENQLKEKEDITTKLSESNSKVMYLETELESLKANYDKIIDVAKTNNEQLEQNLNTALDKATTLENELKEKNEINTKLSESNSKIKELQDEINTLTSDKERFESTTKTNNKELEYYKLQLNQVQDYLKITQEKTTTLENELKEKNKLDNDLSKSYTKINELEVELETYKTQQQKLNSTSKLNNEQLERYTSKFTELESNLKTAQDKVAALENELKNKEITTVELSKSKSKIEELETEVQTLEGNQDKLSNATKTKQNQIKNYSSKISQLEPSFTPETALNFQMKPAQPIEKVKEQKATPPQNSPGTLFDLFNEDTFSDNTPAYNANEVKAIFGKKVKENDLKLIEGIGPKIEKLFHENNITTWKALSECTIKQCKDILNGGGKSYKMYIPDTWPKQSKLAYEKKWQELFNWQEELDGGLF